jgi:sugar phosphate isomerase/epimerase
MWLTFGGGDPVQFIRKYRGRVPALHAKDVVTLMDGCDQARGDREKAQFTEVGTGIVNTAGVVEAARECGVRWITVEQDRPRDLSPMESIKVSYDNLKKLVG